MGNELKDINAQVDDMIAQVERSMRKVRAQRLLKQALVKLETGRWSVTRHYRFVTRLDSAGL